MNRWEEAYREGDLPWDAGAPDPLLVAAVEGRELPEGRALELGCGTGANARFLAESGWDVVGADLSPTAIEIASSMGGGPKYQVVDVLTEEPSEGDFDVVFDRGCFHTFSAPAERQAFVAFVTAALRPGGVWLSLVGSTEDGRTTGPPRRSALQVVAAIEPNLEIVELRSTHFEQQDEPPSAWKCLSRKRSG